MPSFLTPLKFRKTMNETLSESVPTTDSDVRGKAKSSIAEDKSISDDVFRQKSEKRFVEESAGKSDQEIMINDHENDENIGEETNVDKSTSGKGNVLESEESILKTTQVVDAKEASINMSSGSGMFKDWILSQPPRNVSHKERMVWLQERREVGVWVECCHSKCKKWRYLPHIKDPLEIPKTWYCEFNPDLKANSCNLKEYKLSALEEEDLLHSPYSAGSLVWALLQGFPWWPAMVDDCPDTEQFYWLNGFSDIPTYYNVTFFDAATVTRAWILPENLKPYAALGKKQKIPTGKLSKRYQHRLKVAMLQADDAMKFGILARLKKYSFISRYRGPINRPMKYTMTQKDSQRDFSASSTEMDTSDNEETDKDDDPPEKVNNIIKSMNLNLSQNNVVDTNTSDNVDESQNTIINMNLNDAIDSCQVVCGTQLPVEFEESQESSTMENDTLKDAIVPSTQTKIDELTFTEEFETQMGSSPNFEMLIDN